ncbi:MAG: ATP synthase F1 subunit gamma [Bacteroidales bacterium]|nr:ATP synthase F1 subunit gamma [Bacteroidales bacterium]
MASLKEIKGRIASVSSTLKITSAMKMVASAKLHRAQNLIASMAPYESHLHGMLSDLMAAAAERGVVTPDSSLTAERPVRKVAVVAVSSNTSLCGAFNANVVKAATAVVNEYLAGGISPSDITVYSIGRKMAERLKKIGMSSPADFTSLSDLPAYEKASALAQELLDKFLDGTFDKIELVYNHFKSTASQVVTRQTYLPLSLSDSSASTFRTGFNPVMDSIVEPSPEEMLESLLPKVVRLKIFTVLLDSSAAEHAARTVAMQTATDNGNDLLAELTLEYNKGRQQKITSEILDIVGGSFQ